MNKLLEIKNFSHLNNETPNLNQEFFKINKKTKTKKKNINCYWWFKKWKSSNNQHFRWTSTTSIFTR